MRWSTALFVMWVPIAGQAQRSGEPTPYDRARECSIAGDNGCVVRELTAPTFAREYELLIASLRAVRAPEAEIQQRMREYLMRFPTGRMAAQYRQYLVAHEDSL
jgi:hypothetical protein